MQRQVASLAAMAVTRSLLFLTYDEELAPEGGLEICASLAAPIKNIGKDAAGHRFHEFALRQSGLLGKLLGNALVAPDACEESQKNTFLFETTDYRVFARPCFPEAALKRIGTAILGFA